MATTVSVATTVGVASTVGVTSTVGVASIVGGMTAVDSSLLPLLLPETVGLPPDNGTLTEVEFAGTVSSANPTVAVKVGETPSSSKET